MRVAGANILCYSQSCNWIRCSRISRLRRSGSSRLSVVSNSFPGCDWENIPRPIGFGSVVGFWLNEYLYFLLASALPDCYKSLKGRFLKWWNGKEELLYGGNAWMKLVVCPSVRSSGERSASSRKKPFIGFFFLQKHEWNAFMALWLSSSFSFTVTTGIFEQLGPVHSRHCKQMVFEKRSKSWSTFFQCFSGVWPFFGILKLMSYSQKQRNINSRRKEKSLLVIRGGVAEELNWVRLP